MKLFSFPYLYVATMAFPTQRYNKKRINNLCSVLLSTIKNMGISVPYNFRKARVNQNVRQVKPSKSQERK